MDHFYLAISILLNGTRFCGLANQLLVGEVIGNTESGDFLSVDLSGFLDQRLLTTVHVSVGHQVS